MELRHLRYFIVVAEEENVTRAAGRLHVSQPALSRQIKDLEEEIGFLLLERSAKSVRLTEAGKQFLTGAREVLARVEEAVRSARSVAGGVGGEIHAGYAPSLTVRLLPSTLRAFQKLNPRIRVRLHDLSTGEMLSQLREGKLRVAFMVKPTRAMLRGLAFEELTSDPLRVAVAPGHPLARRRSVTLADVSTEPLLGFSRKDYPDYHEDLGKLFQQARVKYKIVEEHDGIPSLLTALESGAGIALLPASVECISGPRAKLLPIIPEPPALIIAAVWVPDKLGPDGEQLLQCARQSVRR